MSFLYYTVMSLFLFICLFLILLVLIQKGRGGGLASAFGGGGGNTAFGSKTGDVLTWATSIVFAIFLVLAACLNLLAEKTASPQQSGAAAAVTAAPTPAGQTGMTPQPPGGAQPMQPQPQPLEPSNDRGLIGGPPAGPTGPAVPTVPTTAPSNMTPAPATQP